MPINPPRPDLPYRRTVIALALFSAISAIVGGAELVIWPRGNAFLPVDLIRQTPFSTFLAPGIILGGLVGGTSLACVLLAWRHPRAAIDATIVAGGALTLWIAAEVAILRATSWLTLLYGGVGVALLGLGVRAGWRSRSPRARWLIAVTFAGTLGFLVPASAGILSAKAGLRGAPLAALVVAAGFVEGAALGTGQALAFPIRVRRPRYALLTSLAAGAVWLCVTVMSAAMRDGARLFGAGGAAAALMIAAGAVVVLVALATIGTAQWLELRHHAPRAYRWIAWTALAWALALPLSFTPAPFVDESTPLASHQVLWGCAGMLMAFVMAAITWQGARRLSKP